jgi:hypothetical protein
VPDVDADSFEKMLVYIYKGTVDLEGMDVGQILALHSAGRFFPVATSELREPKIN